MRSLVAAIVSSSLWVAVEFGTFVPLAQPDGIEYVYVWPGGPRLLAWSAAAAGLITLAHWLVGRAVRRRESDRHRAPDVHRWMRPLMALSAAPLGILPAVPGVGERAAPFAYLFFDLRYWWLAAVIVWAAARVLRLLRSAGPTSHAARPPIAPPVTGRAGMRVRALDAVVFVVVVAWATATSPPTRFSSQINGDEPKYLRFCETWYQGHGLDISQNRLIADMPIGASRVLANLPLLGSALIDDARSLGHDLAGFTRDPTGFRWNRSSGSLGFVSGKRGSGVYQIHQPGLSAVLFPGYYLDRRFLSAGAVYRGQFPSTLPMTNLTLLVIYGMAGIVWFRSLRLALGPNADGVAAASACFAMTTMPITAFAFQIYPEVLAFAMVAVVGHLVWFSGEKSRARWQAWAAGIGAGSLAWLHPRFLLLSVALAGFGAVRFGGAARRSMLIGWLGVMASIGYYNYHVTGSWLPNAFYTASADLTGIDWSRVPDNLIAYFFHGRLGLIAQAVWLLAVVPGLVLLWRTQPAGVAYLSVVSLALLIPAAGHALNPAGGTPGRFVAAVVPLLVWPVALLVTRLWWHRVARFALVVLAVMSLDAALSYNFNHVKGVDTFIATTASGWQPHLAFPEVRRHFTWPFEPHLAVIVAWAGAMAVAAWWVSRRSESVAAAVPQFVTGWTVAIGFAALLASMTALTWSVGRWTHRDYLLPVAEARLTAGRALVTLDRCRACFSSRRSQIDWRWFGTGTDDRPAIQVGQEGRTVSIDVTLGSDQASPALGQLRVDFGDGQSGRVGLVDRGRLTHRYRSAGTFRLSIVVEVPSASHADGRYVTVR